MLLTSSIIFWLIVFIGWQLFTLYNFHHERKEKGTVKAIALPFALVSLVLCIFGIVLIRFKSDITMADELLVYIAFIMTAFNCVKSYLNRHK